MKTEDDQANTRVEAIMELFKQVTICGGGIFDCRDPSLQQGRLEEVCSLDIRPAHNVSRDQIASLLRARSQVNLRLRIAERMLQDLEA